MCINEQIYVRGMSGIWAELKQHITDQLHAMVQTGGVSRPYAPAAVVLVPQINGKRFVFEDGGMLMEWNDQAMYDEKGKEYPLFPLYGSGRPSQLERLLKTLDYMDQQFRAYDQGEYTRCVPFRTGEVLNEKQLSERQAAIHSAFNGDVDVESFGRKAAGQHVLSVEIPALKKTYTLVYTGRSDREGDYYQVLCGV